MGDCMVCMYQQMMHYGHLAYDTNVRWLVCYVLDKAALDQASPPPPSPFCWGAPERLRLSSWMEVVVTQTVAQAKKFNQAVYIETTPRGI